MERWQISLKARKTLMMLSSAYQQLGDNETATSLLQTIKANLKKKHEIEWSHRPSVVLCSMCKISDEYEELGDLKGAQTALEQILQIERANNNLSERSYNLYKISKYYQERDNRKNALIILKASLEDALATPEDSFSFSQLHQIINLYIELDDKIGALAALEKARIAILQQKKFFFKEDRYLLLHLFSRQAEKLGDSEAALILTREARHAARKILPYFCNNDPAGLINLSNDCRRLLEDSRNARKFLKKAKELVTTPPAFCPDLHVWYLNPHHLTNLSKSYLELGDRETALEMLKIAKTSQKKLQDPKDKDHILLKICELYQALDNFKKARKTAMKLSDEKQKHKKLEELSQAESLHSNP